MSSNIHGYRELAPDELALINAIKENGNEMGAAVEAISEFPGVDQRALSIAKTYLQTGLMWLTRAIARPGGF